MEYEKNEYISDWIIYDTNDLDNTKNEIEQTTNIIIDYYF